MSERGVNRRGPLPSLLLLTLLGVSGGCDGLGGKDEESSPEPEAPAVEAKAIAPEAPPAPAPPSLLAGVLERAIEPPPEGGSTYRVDAYLGALLVEQLRRDPLPFIAWRSESDDPALPSAGYRVGPLSADDVWTRLGLREGDIITELNGVASTDEGWVTEALTRGENRITVTVFREDASSVLSYRLMGAMAWNDLRDELAPPSETLLAQAPAEDDGGEPSGETAGPGEDRGGGLEPSGVRPGANAAGSGGGGRSPAARPTQRPTPSRPSTGSGRPSGGGSSAVAQCTTDSRCTLKKSYFDSIVRSPSKLESQANIVPAIRNDVHSGYKLKSVRSGSAVAQLGFRSGDKITHINGRDLTNDLEAMQLYMGLSGTRRFNVRYVRGGSARTKTIDVV